MFDSWELIASAAGMLFNFSFVSQLLLTRRTQDVSGLSLVQWSGFTLATVIFIGYYMHLDQWIMVGVSAFGLFCTVSIMVIIISHKIDAAQELNDLCSLDTKEQRPELSNVS